MRTRPPRHFIALYMIWSVGNAALGCKKAWGEDIPGFTHLPGAVKISRENICDSSSAMSQHLDLNSASAFLADLFTGSGLHPTLGSVAPGSGMALGARLSWQETATSGSSVESRVSIGGAWAAGADIAWSPITFQKTEQALLAMGVYHYSIPSLPFYGIGENSQLANKKAYSLDTTTARVGALMPYRAGRVDLKLEGVGAALWTAQGNGRQSTGGPIEGVFSPDAVPGLNSAPGYWVYGARLRADLKIPSFSTGLSGSVLWYHDRSGTAFSFRQAQGRWNMTYGSAMSTEEKKTLLGSGKKLFFLTSDVILVNDVAATRNSVPFFLMPTIGGADLGQRVTLAAFEDYRFRAPTVAAWHMEASLTIQSWIAGFAMYDTGRVANSVGDLGAARTHQSIGGGLTLEPAITKSVRVYYAWTQSEGGRIAFQLNMSGLVSGLDEGIGPFSWFGRGLYAGERGVFDTPPAP